MFGSAVVAAAASPPRIGSQRVVQPPQGRGWQPRPAAANETRPARVKFGSSSDRCPRTSSSAVQAPKLAGCCKLRVCHLLELCRAVPCLAWAIRRRHADHLRPRSHNTASIATKCPPAAGEVACMDAGGWGACDAAGCDLVDTMTRTNEDVRAAGEYRQARQPAGQDRFVA